MKLILIVKGALELLPPAMTTSITIRELGHDLEIIASQVEPRTKAMLAERGINVVDVMPEAKDTHASILRKLHVWRTFGKRAWKHIDREGRNALLWVSSGDSALALGRRLLRRRYVLQLHELYDRHPLYRHSLAKYARRAVCVVVPELSRACIYRYWYDLQETPLVLPNKPTNHPRRRKLAIQDERARAIMATLNENKKIVLYQGHIGPQRELHGIAEAMHDMNDAWRFVVMGPARLDYLQILKTVCPSLIYIPKVTAPHHLEITSHAYVGVVTYRCNCLNNIFCAPNKTWEYAGFGIPILCNELPPLWYSVYGTGSGLCVDTTDSEQVTSAIREIDGHYESFSGNAQRLYDSIDLRDVVRHALEKAQRGI